MPATVQKKPPVAGGLRANTIRGRLAAFLVEGVCQATLDEFYELQKPPGQVPVLFCARPFRQALGKPTDIRKEEP